MKMSLYSNEEICPGCQFAVFHDCCHKFCRCTEGQQDNTNGYNGTCEYRIKKEQENKANGKTSKIR